MRCMMHFTEGSYRIYQATSRFIHCMVLLKMTEDWRACLDRRGAVAVVAGDLS